jgi:hypothetical protein
LVLAPRSSFASLLVAAETVAVLPGLVKEQREHAIAASKESFAEAAVDTDVSAPASVADYSRRWPSELAAVNWTSVAYSIGMKACPELVFDGDTGFDSDVAHKLIDALDSFVADCRSMPGTFVEPLEPAGEHTSVVHGHVSAAMRRTPEKPTGACDRSEDKVVACVRLPRP